MTAPSEESQETGRIFYEAWAGALGWKFRGAQLPGWARLEPFEQDAFRAGAHQVMQKGWVQSAPAGAHRKRDG